MRRAGGMPVMTRLRRLPMNNLIRVACALAAAGMAASAAASPIDFHGYFRSGSGSSDQGGKEL